MLLESVDFYRLDAGRKLVGDRRAALGQFLTPAPTARLMASMPRAAQPEIRLLDAGAGVGSLTAAFVAEICSRAKKPKSIAVSAYEIDAGLIAYLRDTLSECKALCEASGICFSSELHERDFIDAGVGLVRQELYSPINRFHCAILNPPYRKIASDSETRLMLREIGVETSNLYTGFLSVVLQLLADGGELVAITPRSFCNGPYFKPFRKLLLDTLKIRRVHIFESRQVAFKEDEVLQENVIFHGVKSRGERAAVTISSSAGPEDDMHVRDVAYHQLVRPGDGDYFIHLVPDNLGDQVAERMSRFHSTLNDLGLEVSTGRVVDFRATKFLRKNPGSETVPLIYPGNLKCGFVEWPRENGKKPQAMAKLTGVDDLLVPSETYVLVKRFSAKEERRRVVAAVYDPGRVNASQVGFENHLNYYHRGGRGLPANLAKGLAAYLNSTLVDLFFRQFSGHTQVNATDLRSLRYPQAAELEALGSRIGDSFPHQDEIDHYMESEVLPVANGGGAGADDPVKAKKRIDEALEILRALGLPREQQNERSALTLLSLLDLKPATAWADAESPLMGITPMMEFFEKYYGKRYAPNTRETVRRQTVHQFLQAGLIVINPDKPARPTNSPKAVYQVEKGALQLLRAYGSAEWEKTLRTYLTSVETLKRKYAQEREMKRIPIVVAAGKEITLSPGGQNVLVEKIIKEFCERFVPGGQLVYVGDTDEKWAYFDQELLKSLGTSVDVHGKMPDVIAYHKQRNWLVLIEAVTSHGPVNPKRRNELKVLFKGCQAGLVFVTAFLDRRAMVKYLNDISWETEVWVADAPTHLIHFNGERFLGPHPD